MAQSKAEIFAALPKDEQVALLNALPSEAIDALNYDWTFWGRPEQQWPTGDWLVWLLLAGRGFGKTRTGAEYVYECVRRGYRRGALVAPTTQDIRQTLVEGEAGILNVGAPSERPQWFPSEGKLVFPNGALAYCYPATEPERLRGPNNDFAWCDEMATWKHWEKEYNAWVQLQMTLRASGRTPRTCVTTTPQPLDVLVEFVEKWQNGDPTVRLTKGSTFDNSANLAPEFLNVITQQFEGTRIGRQELYAEILDDVPGAMWQRENIDQDRIKQNELKAFTIKDMERIVVAVDPATTNNKHSDETGIIVAGKRTMVLPRGFVLADLSGKFDSDVWGKIVVQAYKDYEADKVVGEVNQGGDLVEKMVRLYDKRAVIPFKAVRATRGKAVRAEPVAALYQQHRVHHVGLFNVLEDQMCKFKGDGDDIVTKAHGSPDRVDALVWAMWELLVKGRDKLPPKKIKT